METVKIELNLPMLNIVLAGLGKLPLDQSIETFTAIRQQAEAQIQQAQQQAAAEQQVRVDTISSPSYDTMG